MSGTIKIGKVKLNYAGFRRLRTSPEAQALVEGALQRIAAEATRLSGETYEVGAAGGRGSGNRARGIVRPATAAAAYDAARNTTLVRALDAGRRGL